MILIIFVFCISYENNDLIQYFPIYSLITKLFSKGVAAFSIVLGSIVVLIIHLNYITQLSFFYIINKIGCRSKGIAVMYI